MSTTDARLRALRDALPGQVLPGTGGQRYPIAELLGEGGQGWVFRATWNEPHGYQVVVKVLRPDAATKDSLARFQREAEVLRRLSQQATPNPHIVRFFDHAQATVAIPSGDGWTLAFTVLEYVHGSTLEQLLAQARGSLGVGRARRLLRHVVLALEHVHAQNVIHRDLKPSNILVDGSGGQELAKVTDFGLAKLFDSSFAKTTALAGATVGYAPPEQFEHGNARVGRHTDVFSLAAIIYEMLTGRPAFPFHAGDHPVLVLTRILNAARPALARVPDALPRELAARPDVVAAVDKELARALSPEPSDRHASVTALSDAIEQALSKVQESMRPPPRPSSAVMRAAPTCDDAVMSSAPTVMADVDPTKTHVMARESASPTSRSSQWGWRARTPSVGAGTARAAGIARTGDTAVAFGSAGALRWDGDRWTPIDGAGAIDAARVRAVTAVGPSDALVVGELSLAARLRAGGAATWSAAAPDVTYLGAHLDPSGVATIVGERPDRRGGAHATHATVVITDEATLPRVIDVPSIARLRSIARVSPRCLVACGDGGALVSIVDGAIDRTATACAADLTAIAALPDGSAVVAGKGGFVFQVWPDLRFKLEAIQTTRDLWAVAVDAGGLAWAGGVQARVMRRGSNGWVRVGADLQAGATIVAVWASAARIVCVCDDGAVIEGALRL